MVIYYYVVKFHEGTCRVYATHNKINDFINELNKKHYNFWNSLIWYGTSFTVNDNKPFFVRNEEPTIIDNNK